jgi:hypothetical protein
MGNPIAAAAPRLSSTTFYRSSLRDEAIKRYSFIAARVAQSMT